MTDQELEYILESPEQVDTHEYRNPDDEDDYFTMTLYRTSSGRHFRVMESSGMNSRFDGVMNDGLWLNDDEVANWVDF